MHKRKVPSNFSLGKLILLSIKENNKDLVSYRFTSLLSKVNKLFSKILTNRLTSNIYECMCCKQVDSTNKSVNTVPKMKTEYNKPLCFDFS